MTDLFDEIFFDGLKKSILNKRRPNKSDTRWLRQPKLKEDKLLIRNIIHTIDSKIID